MQIRVEIHDDAVRKGLADLARRGANLRPLMQDIGEEAYRSVQKNFDIGGRPTPWKTSDRVRREGGKTLSDTARLRRSITVDADSSHVRVGTNVEYARIHQLGGKTKPHVIRPRHAKGLFWPGAQHPVKAVKHPGSVFPARPFLTAQDDDMRRIERIAADYIGKQ